MAEGLEDLLGDLGDFLVGVYDGEDTLLIVVFLDRLGLPVPGFELPSESLLCVVLALHERSGVLALLRIWGSLLNVQVPPTGAKAFSPTADDALDQFLVVGYLKYDHLIQADAALL